MAAIALDARDVTFRDVELLIYSTLHKFRASYYAGEYEEQKSIAFYAYSQAYNEWRPGQSSFSTTVVWYITKQLLEDVRRRAKKAGRLTYKATIPPHAATVNPSRIPELVDSLTADAKTVVALTLETPQELMQLIKHNGTTPKQGIRSYLEGLNWSANRITEAFKEIRQVLTH